MSEETIQELFARSVSKFGKRTSLVFGGKEMTYEETDKESNRLANGLKSLGVTQGTKVAVMLPNIPEFVYAFFAIQKLGAIAVPMNTLYKGGEILYVLRDSGAETIITLRNYVPAIQEVRHETSLRHIVSIGERDMLFADPSCKFIHLVVGKDNFKNIDELYYMMGNTLLRIAGKFGVTNAWYKHRGSIRVNGHRLGGIVVQETESDYIITLTLFVGELAVDDFIDVIWVPPEIRDRIVEPMTSIEKETGKTITHEEFREVAVSALGTVLEREPYYGKLTRDESFAHQRRKGSSKK
jgi:long-chain acyl-CoA synthetase